MTHMELPPRFAPRVTVGTEVAPARPAVIRAILIGTALLLGIDSPLASLYERDQRWRGHPEPGDGLRSVLTGVTQRLMEEASKRFRSVERLRGVRIG
jgi:hypothetical protein